MSSEVVWNIVKKNEKFVKENSLNGSVFKKYNKFGAKKSVAVECLKGKVAVVKTVRNKYSAQHALKKSTVEKAVAGYRPDVKSAAIKKFFALKKVAARQ